MDQGAPLAAAVDSRTFNDGFRHIGLVERAHDDDPVRGKGHGQEQRPYRILESQHAAAHVVVADHAAGKQHRKEGEEGKELAVLEVRAAQRVGIQAHGHGGNDGAGHRGNQRVLVGRDHDGSVTEQIGIGVYGKLQRPEPVAVGGQGQLTGEGRYNNDPERENSQQTSDHKENVEQ